MKVFFYGLFMDESLLAGRGIAVSDVRPGFVEDYELRIGRRATLLPRAGSRAWGVTMEVAADDVTTLYADESVADYAPEPVAVTYEDGTADGVACYNLPAEKVTGTNKEYAAELGALAKALGFPSSYLEHIRQQAGQ